MIGREGRGPERPGPDYPPEWDREPDEVEELSYELSSSPVFAFTHHPVTLLVGVEEQPDGKVRAYLGARWRGIYLLLDSEEAEPFRRAWGTGRHVWMAPVPPAELLHREEVEDPDPLGSRHRPLVVPDPWMDPEAAARAEPPPF